MSGLSVTDLHGACFHPCRFGVLETEEGVTIMDTTEIARELRLVPSFHEESGPGPAEQGIHETRFVCFTQL
jgi:hypothetical protein